MAKGKISMKCPGHDCDNTVFQAERLDTFPDKRALYAVICSHCGEVLGAFDGSITEHLSRIEAKLDRLLEQ
jgi:hypothetical protein